MERGPFGMAEPLHRLRNVHARPPSWPEAEGGEMTRIKYPLAKAYGIRIPEWMWKELNILSEKEERDVSRYIRMFIEDGLAKRGIYSPEIMDQRKNLDARLGERI